MWELFKIAASAEVPSKGRWERAEIIARKPTGGETGPLATAASCFCGQVWSRCWPKLVVCLF